MARKTARLGRQTPTQALVLPYDETKGGEAVELYEQGGRTAMDWQKVLLYDMMAVDDDGLWVHSKFGLSVPRRNGKSEVDKMRELWGLFHGEHILHTAHRTTTKHSAWIFTNVPLAGEDRERRQGGRKKKISIHVPLAGDDGKCDGKYGVFPRTFVTTRHSVQKHAALLCSMRPFSRRICTKRPKNAVFPGANRPAFFCALRVRTGFSCAAGAFARALLHQQNIVLRPLRCAADMFDLGFVLVA